MSYTRPCPKCSKEISYTSKESCTRATKKGSSCNSCSKRNVPRSAETRRKIGSANKGTKHTAEAKRNMSIAKGGNGTVIGNRPYEVQQAQTLCRKLANYECAICGSKDRVAAHHIIWYCQAPDLGANMDNLICLCHECHCKAHGWNQ